jgi:UTP--glucose-1-phosphate uridylyltransferase
LRTQTYDEFCSAQADPQGGVPVAGLGTRFLPATKVIPKEMLPIIDRPLIHYAVDETREAGVDQPIFVTGRGKTALVEHFD